MKKRTYYLICMGVILVIALIMSVKGGLFSAGERAEIFRILSDSFFVPGVLFVGAGALSWGAILGRGWTRKNIVVFIAINSSVTRGGGAGNHMFFLAVLLPF